MNAAGLEGQRPALLDGARALGVPLGESQVDRLLAYGALILKWNKVYNLTALRDPAAVLTHHLMDSLAAVPPLTRVRPGETRLLDVGAGAGLPGVVIAILRPDVQVHCLDAVAKKMAFVQQVASELKLPNLRGVHARVESWTGAYDVISSRAFASLPDFFSGSRHLLATDGLWLAMKGKVPQDELTALQAQALGVDVFHVEQLAVPGLDADRCIVWARPAAA
ncbi:16S rRNA (guanine(527)-N(7))-methyltransferase RsmG [Xenophilus sp. Marseille-Q4582]|uniref:16S rRNA (guanine(527)-N(7))-methyltransferase RsmG n=1 Tax=Xenophilus sp. Marseille-Q4582 TaxID=2866600 RepID=UPI001CE4A110|nr:16S rRNA (guanine(527)-N(7))-methyltransferase RsmG [Xenophilus sp. Marseille-Q4582]